MTFAAGAILCMLASTMLPEAAREGGPVVGLVTAAGFFAAVCSIECERRYTGDVLSYSLVSRRERLASA